MNASDVMSHNPIAVPAEAGLAEALRLMFDHRISGIPVVDGKAGLVRILTEGDLLRRSELGTSGQRSRWLDLLIPGLPEAVAARRNLKRRAAGKCHRRCAVPPNPAARAAVRQTPPVRALWTAGHCRGICH